ncbi:MAG: hypothetical protein ACRCV9_10550 [Burkholderiaceae bacterium]
MKPTNQPHVDSGPTTISDPLYKTQPLVDALHLLAKGSKGIYQLVSLNAPTIVIDLGNGCCFARAGDAALEQHANDMVSVRRLTELPKWAAGSHMLTLEAMIVLMREHAAPSQWRSDCTYQLTRMPPISSGESFKFDARIAALCISRPVSLSELQLLAGSSADQVRRFLRDCEAAGCLIIHPPHNAPSAPRGLWAKIHARINPRKRMDLLIAQ